VKIEVRLYSVLQRYLPGDGDAAVLELPEGARLSDVLNLLAIPREAERVTLVNGHHAEESTVLSEGDAVTLFPPIAGG
jgi:sulfur-carrier protein